MDHRIDYEKCDYGTDRREERIADDRQRRRWHHHHHHGSSSSGTHVQRQRGPCSPSFSPNDAVAAPQPLLAHYSGLGGGDDGIDWTDVRRRSRCHRRRASAHGADGFEAGMLESKALRPDARVSACRDTCDDEYDEGEHGSPL
jgi:hypothetical protein